MFDTILNTLICSYKMNAVWKRFSLSFMVLHFVTLQASRAYPTEEFHYMGDVQLVFTKW